MVVVQTKLDTMHEMRQSGATLEQIGSRFGITRERVRQLLARDGSTRVQELLTTIELCRLASCTWNYVNKLRRRGVIQPAKVVGHSRILWSRETATAAAEYIDRLRCPVCQRPVPSNRRVYCSRQCYLQAHRYKNQPEEERSRQRERVKRWMAEHPERAREIERRKERRRQAKRSLQRYQTTEYLISKKCLIPLGTIVRVLSYNRAEGRLKVEWGDQIVELPFGCVKRIVEEPVAMS